MNPNVKSIRTWWLPHHVWLQFCIYHDKHRTRLRLWQLHFKESAMFKKLLLPLDLTDKHHAVIDTAEKLALQNNGEVTLLHVIEVITGLSAEEEKHFYQRLEHAAGKHLQIYARSLAERKAPYRQKVLIGNRVREIVAYAKEIEA